MSSTPNTSKPNLLIIVTGTGKFANDQLKTGLWLSELTHIYHAARDRKYEITIASPRGGVCPVDPESLKPIFQDKLTRDCWDTTDFRNELQNTASLPEVQEREFDCVYLAGGHGAMYDFPDDAVLQSILQQQSENRRIVAAICHGVCGLLNVRRPDGDYLIRNRKLTGYSWFEEILAGRNKIVPFDLEEELKKRGADYEKALIPMTSKVVVDGNLITGENPSSSQEMAKVIMHHLEVNP